MMFEDLELNAIEDENTREFIRRLMNMVETLSIENRELKEENQRLRDEINRMKGEQGKPKNKGNRPQPTSSNHSSEAERKKARPRHKRSKQAEIEIDREEVVEVDRETLPEDVQFKGYVDVIVQDIRITSDNVRFRKEKYYSARQRKKLCGRITGRLSRDNSDQGYRH